MRIILILLLLLSLALLSFALDLGERDKQLHLAGSSVLTASCLAVTATDGELSNADRVFCALGVFGIGLFKEFADRDTTGWDNEDLAADALGIALVITFSFTF